MGHGKKYLVLRLEWHQNKKSKSFYFYIDLFSINVYISYLSSTNKLIYIGII